MNVLLQLQVQNMDLKFLIKHEEPQEFFLILPEKDEETNLVAFDKNSNHENLTVPVIDIKQETVTEPDDDVESIDHFRLVKNEFDLETSEFEPDSVFEDDGKKSAHDDENWRRNGKKSESQQSQIKQNFTDISTMNIATCKGPPYTCNICSLTFPVKKSLEAHQVIHKGKKWQCKHCPKVFRNESSTYEHMKFHRKPEFSCPICFKTFALKKSLNRHQSIHEEKTFECDICQKRFRQKVHISEHMKVHRERIKRFKCAICDGAFYEQRTLTRHIKHSHSYAPQMRYRCPNAICDKDYASLESFKMHSCVNGRRSESFMNTNCSLCNKRFFNKCELQRHFNRVHVSKPDDFQCLECDKKFRYHNYGSYVLHVAQQCPDKVTYECGYCSKFVPSKSRLIEHFVVGHHMANVTNAKSCAFCSKLFYHKIKLKLHLKKYHFDVICEHCNITFRSRQGLSLHRKQCVLSQNDSKYQNMECSICQSSFINKAKLLEHMTEVHKGENYKLPLKTAPITKHFCTVCQQSFSTLYSLSKHKRQMHKKKRQPKEGVQYQCTICSIIYTRNDYLRKHIKLYHLNQMDTFECDLCSRAFTSKWTLIQHFRIGDHQTTLQCESCHKTFKGIAANKTHMKHCKDRKESKSKRL